MIRNTPRILTPVALAAALVAATASRAGILAYEGFDIPAGSDALDGAAGASSTGWSGNWNTSNYDIGTGFTYGSLGTVGGAAIADAGDFGSFDGAVRTLASGVTGTIWGSFIGTGAPNGGGGYFAFELGTSGGTILNIGQGWADTAWNVFEGATASGTAGFTGSPTFVVFSANLDAGTGAVYLDPTLGATAPALPDITFTFTPGQTLARIGLRQGGAVNVAFDEIRIGTAYGDVASPIPEPATTAALLAAGAGTIAALARRRRHG